MTVSAVQATVVDVGELMSVPMVAVSTAWISPLSVCSVTPIMLLDVCYDTECCVAYTVTCTSFLHVFMAAGIVVARTIFFFIIVVYLHSHTGLSLLATDSAELAAVVCGEPAIYHRRPSPTVLD